MPNFIHRLCEVIWPPNYNNPYTIRQPILMPDKTLHCVEVPCVISAITIHLPFHNAFSIIEKLSAPNGCSSKPDRQTQSSFHTQKTNVYLLFEMLNNSIFLPKPFNKTFSIIEKLHVYRYSDDVLSVKNTITIYLTLNVHTITYVTVLCIFYNRKTLASSRQRIIPSTRTTCPKNFYDVTQRAQFSMAAPRQ